MASMTRYTMKHKIPTLHQRPSFTRAHHELVSKTNYMSKLSVQHSYLYINNITANVSQRKDTTLLSGFRVDPLVYPLPQIRTPLAAVLTFPFANASSYHWRAVTCDTIWCNRDTEQITWIADPLVSHHVPRAALSPRYKQTHTQAGRAETDLCKIQSTILE